MLFDGCPIPPGEQLFLSIFFVWIGVALLSMLLPRPWFVALFKIAFPWMPSELN
jgi:hypothetical protein